MGTAAEALFMKQKAAKMDMINVYNTYLKHTKRTPSHTTDCRGHLPHLMMMEFYAEHMTAHKTPQNVKVCHSKKWTQNKHLIQENV